MSWNGFNNLNLTDVQEAGAPSLQPGKYVVKAEGAEIKDVPMSSNKNLRVEFADEGGAGTLRHDFRVSHSSPQAQEISLRQLKSFLVHGGHPNPDQPGDLSSLNGLRVGIIVGMGKAYVNKEGKRVQYAEIKQFFDPANFDSMVVRAEQPAASEFAAPAAKTQASAGAGAAPLDDEIPF